MLSAYASTVLRVDVARLIGRAPPLGYRVCAVTFSAVCAATPPLRSRNKGSNAPAATVVRLPKVQPQQTIDVPLNRLASKPAGTHATRGCVGEDAQEEDNSPTSPAAGSDTGDQLLPVAHSKPESLVGFEAWKPG
ncbi:hypothetical protein EON62_00330, partial [archaeon]